MIRPERRFWFVLAQVLGSTVAELQARMSSREFSEWIAFHGEIEPIGEIRADLRLAMGLTFAARSLGARKVDPLDFMPFLDRGEAEPEAQAQAPAGGRGSRRRPEAQGAEREALEARRALYAEFRSWAGAGGGEG